MPYRKTEAIMERLAERHQSIIDAAIKLGDFNMDAIAEEAGVAIGTVYKYFASQEELIEAVVPLIIEADAAAIGSAHNVAGAFEVWMALMQKRPRFTVALLSNHAYRKAIVSAVLSHHRVRA